MALNYNIYIKLKMDNFNESIADIYKSSITKILPSNIILQPN